MSTILLWLAAVVRLEAQTAAVQGGTFTMGSERGEGDELPRRTVTLSPFSIHAGEVTESQYDSCVAGGHCTPAHYDDGTCRLWNGSRFMRVRVPPSARNPYHPVVCVTWRQAQQYCRVRGMSLPSEAQWEYAARAGTTGRYPWGENQDAANHCVISRGDGPQRVGSRASNGWGLYDMIGNAWEWVNDWYAPDAYSVESAVDPAGSPAGLYRIIRGGGWYSGEAQATVSNRQWFPPDFAEASIGFRCVGR